MTRTYLSHPRGTAPKKRRIAGAVSAAVLSTAFTAPAFSQTLEEVIVTATKRSESVQDVPLAITALSGEFVNKVNLDDVKDLVSFTPGVTGNSQDSFIDAISVRGVRTQDFGVGGDPSTAFFKNDLYEGRNGSAVTSLYDIDRAEILRGPQGFLFGRNSIGGAFSVHTKRAEIGGDTSGFINVDVAEKSRIIGDGAVNIPMTDQFAMRVAGFYNSTDGWQRNLYPGKGNLMEQDKWALRWSTTYERDRLGVYTMVEYEEREQSGSVYRAIDRGDIWDAFESGVGPAAGGSVNLRGGDEDIDSDITHGEADDADILTLGLRIDYDLGFATLTSNTGYKDHDYYYSEDYDGTPLDINAYQQDQDGDYFQQELRLTSNSDGALSWYAGASYYKEEIDVTFNSVGQEDYFCAYYGNYYYPGNDFTGCEELYEYYEYDFTPHPQGLLEETGRIKGEYTGWAAYVNLDWYITENFDVEFGLRYTEDEKDFANWVYTPESELGPYWFYGFSTTTYLQDTQTWDDTTGRIMAKWRPADDHMLFVSYTEGYKSGGFGSFSIVDANGVAPDFGTADITPQDGYLPDTFEPETAESWEIGYKGTLFDGKMNVDLTYFRYDYEDLQILYYDGGASLVDNVGEVEAEGFEGSITAGLGENWTLYVAAGYLDSEANDLEIICGSDECEGSPLFWAPEWSAAFMLDAYFPISGGAIVGSFEGFYEGERGGDWTDVAENYIDAYTELAARVGFESEDGWRVEAYVENLTDEFTWDGQNINGGALPSHFFGPKRGRTFGVRLGMTWE
jgi:iron complex outermembrane receptor protein